jgi:hypothetical protein
MRLASVMRSISSRGADVVGCAFGAARCGSDIRGTKQYLRAGINSNLCGGYSGK